MKLSEEMREDICGTAAVYVDKVAQLEEENEALKRENERLKTYASTLLELALDDVDLPPLTTESTP